VVKEDLQQSFAGAFWLINEGATTLTDVVVHYDLLPGKLPTPNKFPDSYPFSHVIGVLENQAEIRVEEAFSARGLNIEELDTLTNIIDRDSKIIKVKSESGLETVMTVDEYDAALNKSLGPFVDEVGTIIGAIEFVEEVGAPKRVVRFRSVVYVFNANRRGLPKPPTAVYHVELEPVGQNYKRVVPISQELLPGAADRFLINVMAKAPSNHQFRVTFRDVTNQTIQSPWIYLRYFIPRSRRANPRAVQISRSKEPS